MRPVRAEAADVLPPDRPSGWAWEPKFDGFRCIAFHDAGRVALQSRQQRQLTRYFPEVVAAVGALDRDVVLDGELVVWRGGRLDFGALQRRLHPAASRARTLSLEVPAVFVVFDLLARDGVDRRGLPYRKRRKKLEKLLGRRLPDGLVLMPMSTDRAVAAQWMVGHTASGIEGVVAKKLDSTTTRGAARGRRCGPAGTAEAMVGGVLGRSKARTLWYSDVPIPPVGCGSPGERRRSRRCTDENSFMFCGLAPGSTRGRRSSLRAGSGSGRANLWDTCRSSPPLSSRLTSTRLTRTAVETRCPLRAIAQRSPTRRPRAVIGP